MRRLFLMIVAISLASGSVAWSRAPLPGAPSAAELPAAPGRAELLELANGTGFAHPALGASQDGRAQFLVLLFVVDVPASNGAATTAAEPVATTAGNEGINITDEPATAAVDKTATRDRLWQLRDQLDRVVRGSRGGGTDNGTAATLSRVETRLLTVERERARELLGVLESGDAATAAYGAAIKELVELRERLRRLTGSATSAVAEGARTLLGEIDGRLEGAAVERATELRTIIESSDSDAAAKAAAAAELIVLRDLLRSSPRGGADAGNIDGVLDTYFKSRVDALTAVLDDDNATATDKAAALEALRRLRFALLDYTSDDPAIVGADSTPAAELLGEVEKRLAAAIRTRIAELTAVLDSASSTAAAKAEALTELLELWRKLREMTAGQTAARNEGDTSHDDMIGNLRDRIAQQIGARYGELGAALGGELSGTELGTAINELLEAWRRLRELGQTGTRLYTDLEGTLRDAIRTQAQNLSDTIYDDDASAAARAAAAAALTELYSRLRELDATRTQAGGGAFEDPTRFEIEELLDGYVGGRIDRLGSVLDNRSSTAAEKAAALAELRRLREMLIRLGRRPANATGGVRGDSRIGDIDRHLLDAAGARLDELARILESGTATSAEKQAALDALEQLRDDIRDLPPGTGETETRIDRLLQRGLDERLRELERELEGGGDAGPPTASVPGGGVATLAGASPIGAGAPEAVSLAATPGMLASSGTGLEGFGLPGGPTLAAIARSTGTSTGPGSFDITVANAGPARVLDGNGVVVEPLSEQAAARVLELWPQVLARANAVVSVDPEGYCLEKEQRPPSDGELFALASAGKQRLFAPARAILRASEMLHEAGQLHPEEGNDPGQYFHAIRQWSIWTHERGYEQQGFTEAFVAHTRDNLEGAGYGWTPEIEAQVRGWAANRYQDIVNVNTAAGFAAVRTDGGEVPPVKHAGTAR